MKKTFGILLLALLLSTSTVSAATIEKIYGINSGKYPPLSYQLPLTAECIVNDAYLRNEPNASSDIITTLQKNDTIYVHTPIIKITKAKTPWYEVTTDDGTHGYIRADFVKHNPNKLDFKYRFEAAFKSSVLFDTNQLRKATKYTGELSEIEPKAPGYETHYAEFMNGIKVHTISDAHSKDILRRVEVNTPNYTVAGLKVGDDFTPSTMSHLKEAMKQMNWSYYSNVVATKGYYAMWVFKVKPNSTSDKIVPIKSFRVHYIEGKITKFSWITYAIKDKNQKVICGCK